MADALGLDDSTGEVEVIDVPELAGTAAEQAETASAIATTTSAIPREATIPGVCADRSAHVEKELLSALVPEAEHVGSVSPVAPELST